jgi:hypothetical protein
MAAVLAGWFVGYAMALLSTAALTYLFVKMPDSALGGFLGDGTRPILAAVPFSIATFLAWTMAGLIIGAVYDVGELGDQPGFLGSPSAPFLGGVAVLAVMPLPLLVLLWRRYWWLWAGMSGAFLGLFGWAMPLLAEQ